MVADFTFYSQKVNVEKTSELQEKYFESMRFKSLHALGRKKSLVVRQASLEQQQEESK